LEQSLKTGCFFINILEKGEQK
jgi:hypothetical protein